MKYINISNKLATQEFKKNNPILLIQMIFHEDNHFFTRFFQVYEAIRMEMEMLNHPFPQMYVHHII